MAMSSAKLVYYNAYLCFHVVLSALVSNIYCDKCTSRTAKLPSGKKPVRVCNRCYSDLTS